MKGLLIGLAAALSAAVVCLVWIVPLWSGGPGQPASSLVRDTSSPAPQPQSTDHQLATPQRVQVAHRLLAVYDGQGRPVLSAKVAAALSDGAVTTCKTESGHKFELPAPDRWTH